MKSNEAGEAANWVDVGSVLGSTNNTRDESGDSSMSFQFKSIEFASLRRLLYDAAWNRPLGAQVRCSIDINANVYRAVAIPGNLQVTVTVLAPTPDVATLSFSTTGHCAGRTLFESSSTTEFDRTSLDAMHMLSVLQGQKVHTSIDHASPTSVAQSFLGWINPSGGPIVLPVNVSTSNPFFSFSDPAGSSAPPFSSFVMHVPAITVAATAAGDIEDGGRFFVSSTAFDLELMKPLVHLQSIFRLQCSDAYVEGGDLPELTHCGMPNLADLVAFYQGLFTNRVHLSLHAIGDNFVTNLAGPRHSLKAELGDSSMVDAQLQQRLVTIEARAAERHSSTPPAAASYHASNVHVMGYGVSSQDSCVTLDADNVYQMFICADSLSGLNKFRMHLLNEESVLLALSVRNSWADVEVAEIRTEVRLEVTGGNHFGWNSTISESESVARAQFAYYNDTIDYIVSTSEAAWGLSTAPDQQSYFSMHTHAAGQAFSADEDLHVDSELRIGMNLFYANISAATIGIDAIGSYDFAEPFSW
jgi:hypothetical protein